MIDLPFIAPCPCCGRQMVELTGFATRTRRDFTHERDDDEPCVLDSVRIIISDRQDDLDRLASWNRRADRTAHFREGWNLAISAAAEVVRQQQIVDASGGQTLEKRLDGNRAGLAYADGIAALTLTEEFEFEWVQATNPFALTRTDRGFARIDFVDRNDASCSLQKSSLATEDALWLGVNDADPKILVAGKGWQKLEVPEGVYFTTRMHLTRELVQQLVPHLIRFVGTGDL